MEKTAPMVNNFTHYTLHLVIAYAVWFACVLGAARGSAWFGPMVVLLSLIILYWWQAAVVKRTRGLLKLISLFFVVGLIGDSFLLSSGWIHFAANPFTWSITPPWMLALWVSSGMTTYATLHHYLNKYLWFSMGALLGFPIAYGFGVGLGAASLHFGYFSAPIIGMLYAILLPLALKIYQPNPK
jgi:hypothetical protein